MELLAPTCGSPGDAVRIVVKDPSSRSLQKEKFCTDTDTMEVRFETVRTDITAISAAPGGDPDKCQLDVVVPAGARTGPVFARLSSSSIGSAESAFPFTIPCPPDSGSPDDAGEAGTDGGNDGPLGGVYNLHLSGGAASFDSYLLGPLTPQQVIDAEAGLAHERARLAPPGIAVGTCGTPTLPALPPSPVPGVDGGDLLLKNGATTIGTFSPQASGSGTSYTGPVVGAPLDTVLDLEIAGSAAFTKVIVPGAIKSAPALAVTAPDFDSGTVTAPAGDFTITFTPTQATHMTITVQAISGGSPVVCAVDPKAGTFTIPAATMGGAGTTDSLTFRMGYVIEKLVGGKRHVSIASSSRGGLVSVQ